MSQTPGLTVRETAPIDAHALTRILTKLPGQPWTGQLNQYQLALHWLNQAEGMRRWTALIDGEVVGHIAMHQDNDGNWTPTHLFSEPGSSEQVIDALTTAAAMGSL